MRKGGGQDLIVREFAVAVEKYKRIHGTDAAPRQACHEEGLGAQHTKDAVPCASHASGVELRREAGERPQVSHANDAAERAHSVESGVHGPFNNGGAEEQELCSQGSKHRFYKHHAAASQQKAKRSHKDASKLGAEQPAQHRRLNTDGEMSASARGVADLGPQSQRAAAEAAVPAGDTQYAPYSTGQAATPGGVPYQAAGGYGFYQPTAPQMAQLPGNWQLPPASYSDPKVWQAVQAGLLPPPPIPPPQAPQYGFGQGFWPPGGQLSPWHLQFLHAFQGALQGQTMLQQMPQQTMMQAASNYMTQTTMQAPPQPSAPPQAWPAPTMSAQSLEPSDMPAVRAGGGVSVAAAAGAAPASLGVGALGDSCKKQIEYMAQLGLPGEDEIEAAARAKAVELGDPLMAQLLLAWYYAGFYTNQAANKAAHGGENGGGGA